jgi:hypothetical protein
MLPMLPMLSTCCASWISPTAGCSPVVSGLQLGQRGEADACRSCRLGVLCKLTSLKARFRGTPRSCAMCCTTAWSLPELKLSRARGNTRSHVSSLQRLTCQTKSTCGTTSRKQISEIITESAMRGSRPTDHLLLESRQFSDRKGDPASEPCGTNVGGGSRSGHSTG